jgi:hypothetical protein
MGRADPNAIFCQRCQGWWIVNEGVNIHCGPFDDMQWRDDDGRMDWKERCPACEEREGAVRFRGKMMENSRVRF